MIADRYAPSTQGPYRKRVARKCALPPRPLKFSGRQCRADTAVAPQSRRALTGPGPLLVVPDLGRDLAATRDAADGLDRRHRGEPGPVPERGERREVGAGEHPPADQPAVALVERVEAGAQRPAEREGVRGEPGLHLRVRLL